MSYWFGGLIFGGPYTWRDLFSEFYGIVVITIQFLHSCFCEGFSNRKCL